MENKDIDLGNNFLRFKDFYKDRIITTLQAIDKNDNHLSIDWKRLENLRNQITLDTWKTILQQDILCERDHVGLR